MKTVRTLLGIALPGLVATGCFLASPSASKPNTPAAQPAKQAQVPADQGNTNQEAGQNSQPGSQTDPGVSQGSSAGNQTGGSTAAQNPVLVNGAIQLPADPAAAIAAADVPFIQESRWQEFAFHFKVHLDVFWNGQAIQIPADIGVLLDGRTAAIHNHKGDGVFDVADFTQRDYTLGQLFKMAGADLSSATVYSDGEKVSDPANLKLYEYQEIAVVFGDPPAQIPSMYAFAGS